MEPLIVIVLLLFCFLWLLVFSPIETQMVSLHHNKSRDGISPHNVFWKLTVLRLPLCDF